MRCIGSIIPTALLQASALLQQIQHLSLHFSITGRYSCLLFTGASFAFWGSNIFNRRHRPLLVLLQLIVGKVDLHSGRLGDRPGGVRGRRGGRLEEVIVIVEGSALDDGG